MRGVWIAVVATGCGFSPSTLLGGGDARGDDVRDANSDATDATPDGPPDAPPDAYVCNTTGLSCPGSSTIISRTCNGGCWVSCTSNQAMTDHDQVAKRCKDWGGQLAPIRTAGDQTCMATTIFPSQASWIGFEQAPGAVTLAGGWTWNGDGVTPTYLHWGSGQPNDNDGTENGEEQCAMMNTGGDWHDTDCTGTTLYRFSCLHD